MTDNERPSRADRDSGAWWDALDRGELLLQRCDDCGTYRWPPRVLCNRCGSLGWSWVPASRRGRVASWIVNHHRFADDADDADDPAVTVLVQLAEQSDILMPGELSGADGSPAPHLGLEVQADIVRDDRWTRLVWSTAPPDPSR